MVTKQIQELEATKAKIVALEKTIAKELSKELASLHAKYGFDSLGEFIKAIKAAVGTGKGRKSKATKAAGGKSKRRHRAVITEDTRANVKKLVEAKKTGTQIAKTLGSRFRPCRTSRRALASLRLGLNISQSC